MQSKGYQQIHSKTSKQRDSDSKRQPRYRIENTKKIVTLKESSEYQATLNKLKEENTKLTKFYNEHKYLEEKLLKSKELIDTLLSELSHYKDKTNIELDIDLQATTLMSHSKLLAAQLNCIEGKVSNLSFKIFKNNCTCGHTDANEVNLFGLY